MNDFFPTRLKEARSRLGLTQKQVGEEAQVSVASLSAYEKGTKKPPLNVALRLSETLDVSLDWLCGAIESRKPVMFRTCGDVARMLLALEAAGTRFSVDEDAIPFAEDEAMADVISFAAALGRPCPDEQGKKTSERAILKISAPVLARFFKAWRPIRAQHLSGIIDDELYELWCEKQLASLSQFTAHGDPHIRIANPEEGGSRGE